MKFEANREKFIEAINSVKDITSNNLEILNNVKIETVDTSKVKVTATNLDVVITSLLACDVKEQGATTVRAKMLSSMVGAMEVGTTVSFSCDNSGNRATIEGGEAKFNLATLPVKEFPTEASVNGDKVVFTESELKDILKKTAYASADDMTRRALQSVFFKCENGVLSAVATDGKRLASCEKAKSGGGDFEMVLPIATAKIIARMVGGSGDVTLTVNGRSAAKFETAMWTVQTKLIDDEYPNWRQVIPSYEMKHAIIDRDRFLYAIRQASITSSSDSSRVNLAVKDSVMTLKSMNDDESATSDIMLPIKYTGDGVEIILSSKYISDVLSSLDENEVSFNFTDCGHPVTITVDGGNSFGVVMPMRI